MSIDKVVTGRVYRKRHGANDSGKKFTKKRGETIQALKRVWGCADLRGGFAVDVATLCEKVRETRKWPAPEYSLTRRKVIDAGTDEL